MAAVPKPTWPELSFSKNLLAHLLGIPRQRLYVCLKSKRAFLDAERTLLLLAWLQARQQGRTLTA